MIFEIKNVNFQSFILIRMKWLWMWLSYLESGSIQPCLACRQEQRLDTLYMQYCKTAELSTVYIFHYCISISFITCTRTESLFLLICRCLFMLLAWQNMKPPSPLEVPCHLWCLLGPSTTKILYNYRMSSMRLVLCCLVYLYLSKTLIFQKLYDQSI